MTCRELNDFLDEYLDGELTLEHRRRFEEHLRACPRCVAYLRSYDRAVRAARSATGPPMLPGDPPEELIRAILTARPRPRAATGGPQRGRRGRRRPPGAPVA